MQVFCLIKGSAVYCVADGIPSPVVRWEALNQTELMLQNGLNIVTNQKLRSTYTERPLNAGVQNFRCHATQEMRGRAPIELARDFELLVTLRNYETPDRPHRRPIPPGSSGARRVEL